MDDVTYGLDFEYSIFCPGCRAKQSIDNKIHTAMILEDAFFETIKPALGNLIAIGPVGISGMGMFFARYRVEFGRIFDELESLSKHKFILSDGSSDIADKSNVLGRNIYHTDSILDKVKNIIVPSVYSQQIRERVQATHPEMGVYGLFELPFLDRGHDVE